MSKAGIGTTLATMSALKSNPIPGALKRIAAKGSPISGSFSMGMDEAKQEVSGSSGSRHHWKLTSYLCYCQKCGKISRIDSSVDVSNLCKKVFCPMCASDLYRKKKNSTEEVEKLRQVTKEQIAEAAKGHERAIVDVEKDWNEHLKHLENTKQGLEALEEELGSGMIIRKEEINEALLEYFVCRRNGLKDEKEFSEDPSVPVATPGKKRKLFDEDTKTAQDEIDEICQRIYHERIMKDREVEMNVSQKGW